MILFDFSQLIISTSLDVFNKEKRQPDINLTRHIVLNTLLSIKQTLKHYSDEIVLCMDSKNYWRKDIFPEYKGHRQKVHDDSKFDWNAFYQIVDIIKEEFKHNTPYKIIEVDKAEADDTIATLSLKFADAKNVVIVSSDKDFLQLQLLNPKIKQYSHHHRDFLDVTEKGYNLFEHIVKGDSSDAIANILSDDDTYLVVGKKSKQIRTTTIQQWEQDKNNPEYFCESHEMLRKFVRNKKLIDLTQIPENITQQILETYTNSKSNGMKFFNYLVEKKLTKIINKIS